MLNLKTAEAYEAAAKAFSMLKNELTNLNNLSEIIKRACDTVYTQIDNIFGEGTSNKLFGDNYSLDEAVITWLEIDKQIRIATEEENEKISRLVLSE